MPNRGCCRLLKRYSFQFRKQCWLLLFSIALIQIPSEDAASDIAQADEKLRNDPNLNHEYLPIAGLQEFTSASQKLVFGADSPAIKEKRVRNAARTVS